MYDFNSFMEVLSNRNLESDSIKNALSLVKDFFNIGKIEIKNATSLENLEYIMDSNYDKKVFLSYSSNGYEYNFYKKNKDTIYSDAEFKDITLLLKLLGLYHHNIVLEKKEEEAKFTSLNTGLPNGYGYIKKVEELFMGVNSRKYNSYFINIRGFGLINKLFGIEQGDLAIKSYSLKLKSFILDDEIVGHLGGDNFVALIKKERHKEFIDLVNKCPIEVIKDGVSNIIYLTGVVGYYEIESNIDGTELLSNASMACQYARSTRKKVVKQTSDLVKMNNSVKLIEREFKDELEKGNFVVYYQPKFDITTGKINGVETLIRWIHDGKVIPPGMFVPVLEKNGDIVELDLYVLERLCKDIHNYRNLGNDIVPASCNLSRSDFSDEYLENRIIDIIRKYNVKREDIVLEVTETTNLEENERLAKFINTMNKNGIMTSIDDFGTGYSSLSVLRDFKVNEIKIDRSFINRNNLSSSDEIIIGSIIDMAKRLNLNVICEGVETKEQADFLLKLGCNNAQGYLYSKPVPKEEFEAMLKRNREMSPE